MSRLAWEPLANTMIRINGACLSISRSCAWKLCCKRWKQIPLSSNTARRSHDGISDNMHLLVKHIQYDKYSWFSGRNCRLRKAIELFLVLQMGCTKFCFHCPRDGPARSRNCSKKLCQLRQLLIPGQNTSPPAIRKIVYRQYILNLVSWQIARVFCLKYMSEYERRRSQGRIYRVAHEMSYHFIIPLKL